ncbi:glycoside hydrolase family 16 protein [Echinicola marina]|uniref:glycoside hydrolase family 16 protein n=1 Tax=Echinicola marina TaxID=2859768 RepID=UPI001CF6EAA0|nr:glycoside hydrolase family 16 protein [Echinicola marina]UCS93889.1 glycoside hydrolase family 16 protein [Echinicola marina]
MINRNRLAQLLCCPLVISLGACSNGESKESSEADNSGYPGYELVWQEEFDEDGKPNEAYWSYEKGLVRNHELQYYREENANVGNGFLVIEGKREEVKNERYEAGSDDWRKNQEYAHYSSASINTRGKKEFKFGLIEVRAKIDTALGMWPAIWTLGISKGWPANGEVDIMEYYRVNGQATILANAAWKKAGGRYAAEWDEQKIPFSQFLEKDPEWPNKFHVWKMDWSEDHIKLFLDDELLNEIDLKNTLNPDGYNPFHQPHYILLNLAIGGNGGDPSQTDFPKEYWVDYVRVYQKSSRH